MRLRPGDKLEASAILFDMDGTLVNSTPAIERVWGRWANRHGIDTRELFNFLHGVRMSDTVRKFAPSGVDIDLEVGRLMAEERDEVDGITAVAGALDLLNSLTASNWAVVTSADRALANIRMRLAGLPSPDIFVAAEDISVGKPDPEGYLSAANSLGCEDQNILVFEDSAVGLDAGRSAGFRVVGVSETRAEPFPKNEDWILDFTSVAVEKISENGGISLNVVR